MTALKLKDPRVRVQQYARVNVPVASLSPSTLNVQLVPAVPAGYSPVFTRCTFIFTAAGAALTGVGANDNLVIRATNASGAIVSTSITGVGFLDATAGTVVAAVAVGALSQTLISGGTLQLAYAASADGVTIGAATGNLQVNIEYDLVSTTS